MVGGSRWHPGTGSNDGSNDDTPIIDLSAVAEIEEQGTSAAWSICLRAYARDG
jgi:hypothetical protein